MKLKTKELVICSIFASLTAILTQISIPLPAVPLTMQVFAVALCGLVLGKRLGFISQIIYVLLGTIGLPVFAQFSGGIGIILGPTGGFILSFPIIAFVVGYFSEKFKFYNWNYVWDDMFFINKLYNRYASILYSD